jgi:hypothetical protein
MAVTMWEVRAAAGAAEALIRWVLERVEPDVQVYRSDAGPDRVVVIDPAGTAAVDLAGVPPELIARPPHAWDFRPARNI